MGHRSPSTGGRENEGILLSRRAAFPFTTKYIRIKLQTQSEIWELTLLSHGSWGLKMVSNLKGRTYKARLEEVDMTSTYRIMTGKDKVDPGHFFDLVDDGLVPRTRGGDGTTSVISDQ